MKKVWAAGKRVGTGADEARWLIAFADRDLATVSNGNWRQLRWEVLNFLERTRVEGYISDSLTPPAGEPWCSADEVRAMHQWLCFGFESLKQGTWPLRTTRADDVQMLDGSRLVVWDGGMNNTEAFKARAHHVVVSQPNRFRRCPRCRRIFFGWKAKIYCGSKCNQHVRTKRYRSAHRAHVNAQRMKAYYEKKMKGGGDGRGE